MELEKQANLVGDIRAELMDRINTRLKVRANMGRSKIVECEGTLMQAHPALVRRRGRSQAWSQGSPVVPVRRHSYRHGRTVRRRNERAHLRQVHGR